MPEILDLTQGLQSGDEPRAQVRSNDPTAPPVCGCVCYVQSGDQNIAIVACAMFGT